MKVIDKPLGGGKTTALVEMVLNDPELIYIAPTQRQAENAWKIATSLIPRGATIRRDRFRTSPTPDADWRGLRVVVDEVDGVLGGCVAGATTVAIALTSDDNKGVAGADDSYREGQGNGN